jgi:hypothetical protein
LSEKVTLFPKIFAHLFNIDNFIKINFQKFNNGTKARKQTFDYICFMKNELILRLSPFMILPTSDDTAGKIIVPDIRTVLRIENWGSLTKAEQKVQIEIFVESIKDCIHNELGLT